MRHRSIGTLVGAAMALGLAALGTAAQAKTDLVVYTAIEADQLKEYKAAFEKSNPDISLRWVRDSTGIVTAKLMAEKNNPQADVIWGLAATSLMLLDAEGMLEPYAPAGVEALSPKFKDTKSPPAWVGMDAWMAVIVFNTREAEKHGLPRPASWKDLTKPVYKGHIVMPNPMSSGTGFLDVSSWLQLFGEDDGWKFMDALHENMGTYTPFRLEAGAHGRFRRIPDRHLLRLSRRHGEVPRRPRRSGLPQRRPRLGHGGDGDRKGHEEARRGAQAGRLVGHPRSQRTLQQGLRPAAPACTACPPCSSPSWTTRVSKSSTCPRCAPASWPARPAPRR